MATIQRAPTPALAFQRARLVAVLWEDFDAQQRAFTPPKPVLVLPVEKMDTGSADFAAWLASAQAAQQTEARAKKDLTDVQTALEKLHARLDRDNKRWYGAWTKTYPADTPEGILARLARLGGFGFGQVGFAGVFGVKAPEVSTTEPGRRR